MYKPHTIEQYKIQQFLDANFAMEHFLVSPLSRTSLLLEDKTGEQIAFGFLIISTRNPDPAAGKTGRCAGLSQNFPCA